jgi:hypothetical protein
MKPVSRSCPPQRKLHETAETWRNPYGNGGFDKQHGALTFFMPGNGRFPLLLSDIRKHPSFSVVPEREQSFCELCASFDDLGRWLRTGQVGPAIRCPDACLDIAFTQQFLGQFREAVAPIAAEEPIAQPRGGYSITHRVTVSELGPS